LRALDLPEASTLSLDRQFRLVFLLSSFCCIHCIFTCISWIRIVVATSHCYSYLVIINLSLCGFLTLYGQYHSLCVRPECCAACARTEISRHCPKGRNDGISRSYLGCDELCSAHYKFDLCFLLYPLNNTTFLFRPHHQYVLRSKRSFRSSTALLTGLIFQMSRVMEAEPAMAHHREGMVPLQAAVMVHPLLLEVLP